MPEPLSTAARSLLDHQLIAPEIIVAECVNVLWKKHRRQELTREQAMDAIAALPSFDVEIVAMPERATDALAISLALDHSAYDCFYLALAERARRPFVTADETLVRKVAGQRGASTAELLPLSSFA